MSFIFQKNVQYFVAISRQFSLSFGECRNLHPLKIENVVMKSESSRRHVVFLALTAKSAKHGLPLKAHAQLPQQTTLLIHVACWNNLLSSI